MPEIKIRSGGKTREKKPKWFSLLEGKIIENAEERTIKPKWISGQANQFESSVSLLKISNDKRKKEWVLSKEGEVFKIKEKKEKTIQVEHWRTVSEVAKSETRIEKCSGCEYNRSIVEGNCTTHIKFDEGWKVILKNTISRIESSTQMQANFNLTSLARETYNKDPPENEQEFKNLCYLESPKKELILQAELNEKVKEKEEVSFEEISAYTTGWPSSTRAELLAIWIATLLSPSKTEVVIKTDSAVSIINIETSKYTTMARQWLKQKNLDLLLLIRKAIFIKEIRLSLVKVKDHSNNR
ncbi:12041_t:CDS:2 [Gigaspora margarita]|uniref:12041_t:CDS:1 n=1 Tax=Gigaspora margarita TaxID=4874 RepID=A0ABN7URI9_GIGMA|nr:12041_t:CDS:2 [Gigaspora margarita]